MRFSGHGHRVELFLSLLGLPFEIVEVNPETKDNRTSEFLSMNPFGQVPVIVDQTAILFDSNAILIYLAKQYGDASWLPEDPMGATAVQQWLSLSAGPIAFGPFAARRLKVFKEELIPLSFAHRISKSLFNVIEEKLSGMPFAAGLHPSIADIAAYTYIAHAPEGGISLHDYPYIRAWLVRIEALPGFISMARSASVEHLAPKLQC